MIINTNTGLKKKKLEEKESNEDTRLNKKKAITLLILCISLIIVIILYQIYSNYRRDYNYLKEDRGEYLVYTRYNQNNKEVPYINVASQEVKKLNNEIVDYCNEYVNIENLQIKYEYNISGNYLSVIIKVIDNEKKLSFKSFNVNLKTRKSLTEDELLQYFKVDKDIVSASIYNKFVDMYNEEVKEGYIEGNLCDFECYMNYREVDDYLSDVSLAIKNGKLTAYKPFT